jgi:chromosome segregation protein
VARRAAQVQADLRDARLRLLADDLLQLRAALDAEVRDEALVRDRRALVERELAAAQAREAELTDAASAQASVLARAQETWYRLAALEERLRGTASLAAERHRHLTSALPEQARSARDPEDLDREAAAVRAQEGPAGSQLADDRRRLEDAVTRRTDAESAHTVEERALVAAVRAVADRREGLARLTGQVGALRSRAAAAEAELGRLAAALQDARGRVDRSQAKLAALQAEAGGLDEGEVDLDERHEAAAAVLAEAQERLARCQAQERDAERERSTWAARRDALSLSLARDGAAALLDGGVPGVLGTVAALVTVQPGSEQAGAAALGAVADAVAVASPADAAEALARLKRDDAGRAGLLVGGGPAPRPELPRLPDGARWALDLVQAPDALQPAAGPGPARASRWSARLAAAAALVQRHPELRAVTARGRPARAHWAVGGSATAPSLLEVQAAVDEASAAHDDAQRRQERLRFEVQTARADVRGRRRRGRGGPRGAARLGRHAGRPVRAAGAARLRRPQRRGRGGPARAVPGPREQARDADLSGLAALEERLAAAEHAPAQGEPPTELRDRLAAAATAARAAEVEARLAVRTGEERARALAGRAESLERAARSERAARERLVGLLATRSRGALVAAAVTRGAQEALTRIAGSLSAAAADRETATAARAGTEGELAALRVRARELGADLERLTDVVHRDEVARAEQRLRIEQLEERAVSEWGVPLDRLLAEHGPDVPVLQLTATGAADGEAPALPYDRAEQERRAAAAERALAVLGKVNPLALEEYAALEERSAFLTTQLEDLRDTRRDLLTVVRDVDERIHEVFASAFADTAREFVQVFATLFPGGEGGWCSPTPTTCSPPASRCWPGPPARRCPGSRCCPAASAR